jgi:putative endonuclease
MYFTNIIKSLQDGSLYKGHIKYLTSGIKQHNSGKSEFTFRKKPWKLLYYEEFVTRDEAIRREKYFKSAAGRRFIKNLNLQ